MSSRLINLHFKIIAVKGSNEVLDNLGVIQFRTLGALLIFFSGLRITAVSISQKTKYLIASSLLLVLSRCVLIVVVIFIGIRCVLLFI